MITDESPSLLDHLRAVRRRWRTVLALTALVTGAALAFSIGSQKQYDATVALLLRSRQPVDELLEGTAGPGSNDPARDLNTEVELIKVGPAAGSVRRDLALRRSTAELLDQVKTETSNSANLVALTVRDADPALAARIANALADAYVRDRLAAARRRYVEASRLAQRQLAALDPDERRTPQGRELALRARELQIAATLQIGTTEVARRASVPTDPARPRPRLSAMLGIVFGLLFGVGVAVVRELLDRRFKDEESVESFFGRPILAAIPKPSRRRGAVEDADPAEEYGLLVANLELPSVRDTDSTVLMVTSSGPAEGKTSVTFGIAHACARLGLRVIAIEADLRRPEFHRYVGMTSGQGLSGILHGTASIMDELVTLDAETFEPSSDVTVDAGSIAVVPAGPLPANPQQALAQPRMRALIEAARSLADVVLVDTSPIGTVNDAAALTSLVDGVTFIVRLNHTTKDAARRALRLLSTVSAPQYDIVLTDAEDTERVDYYAPVPAV